MKCLLFFAQLPDEIQNSIAFFSSIIGHDCSMPSNAIDGGVLAEHHRQVYTALKVRLSTYIVMLCCNVKLI